MTTKPCHPGLQSRRGFTLMELLVVISITAVLATLIFMLSNRAIRSARNAAELGNLRQAGQGVTLVAADLGYYPPGWHSGTSWAGLVANEFNGENSESRQNESLQSPVLKMKVPVDLKAETVTHFGGNPAIMTDTDGSSNQNPKPPKFYIRPLNLMRPGEQILLAGAPAQNANIAYKRAHSMMYQMRNLINGGYGKPPTGNINNAEKAIEFPEDIKERTTGSMPDFNRYGDGKGRFCFVDGHVEVLYPHELKQKHFAVSY